MAQRQDDELEDREDGEEGDEELEDGVGNSLVYGSWEALCDGIEDDLATHYRYARFTARRQRWCEGGKYFSLDAESPADYPRPRKGDYRIELYRAWSGNDGRVNYTSVPVAVDDPSMKLSVCFRGLPPEIKAPPATPNFDQVQLQAYKERLAETRELQQRVAAYQEKGWEEAKRLRRQNKKLRKKVRKLESQPGGLIGILRELRELAQSPEAVKTMRGVAGDLLGLSMPLRPPG